MIYHFSAPHQSPIDRVTSPLLASVHHNVNDATIALHLAAAASHNCQAGLLGHNRCTPAEMQAVESIAADMTTQQVNTSRPASANSSQQSLLTLPSRPTTASSSLSPAELAHYRSVFSLFDYHSLGFVNTADVGLVLRSLHFNPTERQLSALLNTLDHDGSGLLSFPTFISLVAQHRHSLGNSGAETEDELVGWWDVFDMYREGRLHVREVVAVLSGYGEALSTEDVEALVGEMAVDGDGMVDLRQFVRHMKETSTIDT